MLEFIFNDLSVAGIEKRWAKRLHQAEKIPHFHDQIVSYKKLPLHSLKAKETSFTMIRPMMGRRAKPRKFDMPLRYYNPEDEEKRRKRIRIKTNHRRRNGQGLRVFVYAVGLGIVIWIMSIL